ncbi:nuclear pore complex protein Nup50 isoform X2 [Plodia interpunctella]|uniref:nuclear pore complex protein Nup50 isoform X2 n=1 Tax=Plodia interpunctella TaxID=58824 RepID=UPI002367D5F4|nr:nuclear pore complex protein Nup50 isoform X2 [Plodia interpunctella]
MRIGTTMIQVSGKKWPKKSVFSGFGGFNKTQPSSFDFLANLTNGNKNSHSTANKSDTTVTSTIFSNTPISSNSSNGIFGVQGPSESKPMFGLGTSQPSSSMFGSTTTSASTAMFGSTTTSASTTMFGSTTTSASTTMFGSTTTSASTTMFGSTTTSASTTTASSLFTATKADSTVNDSPFKIQTPMKSTSDKNEMKTNMPISQVSSTMFGGPTTNSSSKLFTSSTNSSPFSIKPSTTPVTQTSTGSLFTSGSNSVNSNKPTEKADDKKITYCSKLKGLNESVSDWIKKHVGETPFCILTPIFKDYEKYLKEIQDEYQGVSKESKTTESPFHIQNNTSLPKPTGFMLGSAINNTENENNKTDTHKVGFGIPMAPTATTATSSLFSTNTSTNTNGAAPFSFGIGKPFSFSSNVQAPTPSEPKKDEENEDEDAPPKVEYKPISEENSVYEQKCKVFVKKDGNFVDKGVGTLYIKKVGENDKHQLLVRANTSLGNVLVNLILASVLPIQRMGKNNVMMMCIPTPDSKPPPVPILIRVKTGEEADELLEMLNKYKS